MSGLWKCACHKRKERTGRAAPVPTSVGRSDFASYSLATRSSANVAPASPSRSDDTQDTIGFQASLPEVLHAFFTSAAQRRAPFAASVSASPCRSMLRSDEPRKESHRDLVLPPKWRNRPRSCRRAGRGPRSPLPRPASPKRLCVLPPSQPGSLSPHGGPGEPALTDRAIGSAEARAAFRRLPAASPPVLTGHHLRRTPHHRRGGGR